MFSIHIVAIVVVLYNRQLSSGVNVIHRKQANFLQDFQALHLLHSRMCALYVALAITAARLIVENALHLLAWLQAKAMPLHLHRSLQAKAMLHLNHPFTMASPTVLEAMQWWW